MSITFVGVFIAAHRRRALDLFGAGYTQIPRFSAWGSEAACCFTSDMKQVFAGQSLSSWTVRD